MEAGSRLRRFCVSVAAGVLMTAIPSAATAVEMMIVAPQAQPAMYGAQPAAHGSQHPMAGFSRTQNFLVFASDNAMAQRVAQAAERFRNDLAVYWLGRPLPPWPAPCPIRVISGPNLAAQGVTTYNPRPVRDFQMEVVGTPERILDSVLPHEVTHTILATHFGRPLPRWADEGICTTVEHDVERSKHETMLRRFLRSRRGIAMNQLFLLKEYPADVLPMYAQGYSVCQFLIAQKGPRTFIAFLQDYMQRPSWTANVKKHYDYDSLKELQDYWVAWVENGSKDVARFSKVMPPKTLPAAGQSTIATGQTTPAAGLVAQAGTPSRPAPSQVRPASLSLADARGNAVRVADVGPLGTTRPATAMTTVSGQSRPASNLADVVQGTALASTAADGWYQRQRDQAADSVAAEPAPTAPAARTPISPPSVRSSGRYSASQPQPEQGMSRNPVSGGRVMQPNSSVFR